MKIIDSHQHFWIYDPEKDSWITDEMSVIKKNFLPNDLIPVFQTHNIDGCVAVQAAQTLEETHFLLNLSEKYDFIKGVVGWVDLQANELEEQLHLLVQHKKLKGIRAIMQGQPDHAFLTNKSFLKGVQSLSKFNLTYDLLVYHDQLDSLIRFTDNLPDQRLILDHCGKPDIKNRNISKWKKAIKRLATHPNIFCKISGLVTEADWGKWAYQDIIPYLDIVGEYFGIERLCFGSDWPVCLLASDYGKMLDVVQKFLNQLTEEAKEKVFSGNAINFYELK